MKPDGCGGQEKEKMVPRVREFGVALEISNASEIVRCARLAEKAGFGSFWIPEDPFFRGAFSVATAVACQTDSLRIGISVINPYTRHPGLIAMEFGALDEISGGRAVLGIGAGARFWIKNQLHLGWERPGRAVREAVDLIRRLLRGERVTCNGEIFRLTDAALYFSPPRPNPPIHLGVIGPKNLQMAGAIADGVILGMMSSPEYIRFAREQVRFGAVQAGRDLDGFEISALLPISISEDEKGARESVKPLLAILLGVGAFDASSPILRCVDFPESLLRQFTERFAQGDMPADIVSDEIIDTFAIAGSPQHCVRRMAAFIEAGLHIPIAFEIPGVAPEQTMHSVAQHLLAEFA
jgi:5,10-methylenetetrahydromethanopterin reductase